MKYVAVVLMFVCVGMIVYALIGHTILEKKPLYIVSWESKATGWKGHGGPMTKKNADIWVKRMNREYPQVTHKAIKK